MFLKNYFFEKVVLQSFGFESFADSGVVCVAIFVLDTARGRSNI
ncbi:MAG: hypothetical protein ACI9Y1_000313 [Lentisphaeria bacterium]|jgi:hypothetical protein